MAFLSPSYSLNTPVVPRYTEILRRLERSLATLILWLTFAAAFLARSWARTFAFLRVPIPVSLAAVLAWAAFLLAPGEAFAQAAPAGALAFLPAWASTLLAGLGIASSGTLAILLIHRLAPSFFAWLANKEVPASVTLIKQQLATSAEGMSHPEAVAIVNHQVDNLSADVSAALLKAGADFGSLAALTGASLLAVVKDAAATFMAGLDEAQLLAALGALGRAEGGNVLAWVEKTIIGLIHPLPAAPTTSVKTLITTVDGTRIVAPAANPTPGAAPLPAPVAPPAPALAWAAKAPAAGGFASVDVLVVLLLAMALGVVLAAGCTASQGAAAKADAVLYGSQVMACTESEVLAAVPVALSSGAVKISSSGVSVDTALLGTQTKADGIVVAWCAAHAAAADIEAAFAHQADGGASIASTDASEMVAKLHHIRLFQASHPLAAK